VTALLAWPLIQRYREQPPPPPPVLRLSFDPPLGAELGSGDDGLDAAISPDGDEVVFVATSGGRTQLWRRRVNAEQAEPIPETDGARTPTWSADGRTIAFLVAGRLKTVARGGGPASDLVAAQAGRGVAALDDGSLVFGIAEAGSLTRLHDGRATAATTLQPGDRQHLWPARAPGGFVYIAVRDDGRRVMRRMVNGASRDLGVTDGHAIVAESILLHVRGGALLAQRLDPDTGTLAGRSTALMSGVGTANGRALVAASTRLLLASSGAPQPRQLLWIDSAGAAAPAADVGDYWQVRLSRDDRTAAVTQLEPQLRTLDIYLLPLAPGSVARALTLALAADSDPVWSPFGRDVVFRSLQDGKPHLYRRDAGADGAPISAVNEPPGDWVATDWTLGAHGAEEFLVHGASSKRDTDVMFLDGGRARLRPVAASGFNESDGRWSPNGQWVSYVSDDFGQPDVFVQPWPSGQRVRVTSAGGLKPRWSRDSRTLYFARDAEILRVTLQTGASLSVSAPVRAALVPGLRDFDVARDGRRLLVIGAAPRSGAPQVRALVDWQPAVQ
jgi:eukaryotic-like serine/threonine-protein kinase